MLTVGNVPRSVETHSISSQLYKKKPLNLASLKHLETHAFGTLGTLDGFQNAPQVTSLALSGDYLDYDDFFPYSQLTKLKVSKMDVTDILEGMRLMPALEECTIVNCYGETYDNPRPVELPKLLSLAIMKMDTTPIRYGTYGQNILNFLSAPLLTDLSVKSLVEQNIIECIFSFLLQSSCPLKNLSLEISQLYGELRIADEHFSITLEKIPTLEELNLSGYCVLSDQLLDHIIPNSESQTALCPRLQSFHFSGPLDLDGEFVRTVVLPRLDKLDDLIHQKEFWTSILWAAPLERTTFKVDLPKFDDYGFVNLLFSSK